MSMINIKFMQKFDALGVNVNKNQPENGRGARNFAHE